MTMTQIPHDPRGKVSTPLPADMIGEAGFAGPNQCYRLWLSRRWSDAGPDAPFALWIGMNPSTASADFNDPTITREIGFTRRFGYKRYVKVNVGDYRATFPNDLKVPGVEPCSPQNLPTIIELARCATIIIMAHGVLPPALRPAHQRLIAALREIGAPLRCLGLTKDGWPRHPVRLSKATSIEAYELAEGL